MEFLLFGSILGLATLLALSFNTPLSKIWARTNFRTGNALKCDSCNSSSKPTQKRQKSAPKQLRIQETHDVEDNVEELKNLKKLYYQLHNLESFPEVLPQAKKILLGLLQETSTAAEALPEHANILSVQSFSRAKLSDFQRKRDQNIAKEWEQYHVRRDQGSPRELFGDKEEAIWWLKQIAPVKYVDGAWLGHIGKVTTPYALLQTVKSAWQILSEELGDGDLEKNHAHLFHKLIETVAPGFPTAETLDFGHTRHQLNELSVWKAAIAQLLISLFPSEFLPEILGFNLHFEAISMDTLKAGKELKEVGIDPYYFILHVSIDNADSGHTAIAIEIVCEYMDYIRRVEGEEAAQKAWRKLQAGYLLSSGLPGTAVSPSRRNAADASRTVLLSPVETEVIRIFRAKAEVTHGIHCSSQVKIGSQRVVDWLDPVALASVKWQKGLLDALSGSKYWICKGNSSKSRFINELQWSGRMFGSFTQDECDVLRTWIDNLPSTSLVQENQETQQSPDDNILSGYPEFQGRSSSEFSKSSNHQSAAANLFSFQSLPPLSIGNNPKFEEFLPLWLSHPCLLQGFVSIPFRTKNEFSCAVIRILRAQGGFLVERECVAGMGEVRRPNSLGLLGIGMNIITQHGLSLEATPSLKYVLQAWPSKFAVDMLHISMRPMEYRGLLIGMATAFAKLHVAIVESRLSLISAQDHLTLQSIAQRELEGLEFCWKELMLDKEMHAECCAGYVLAQEQIERCFTA